LLGRRDEGRDGEEGMGVGKGKEGRDSGKGREREREGRPTLFNCRTLPIIPSTSASF
jgi:hypothetical protein